MEGGPPGASRQTARGAGVSSPPPAPEGKEAMQTTYPTSVYTVPSDSTPGLTYTVAAIDGVCACGQRIGGLWHCSCPNHVHRARDCKHVKRVVAGLLAPAAAAA